MQSDSSPLIIGRVNGVYGVKGWVKVRSFTRPENNILNYSPVLLDIEGHWQEKAVEAAQSRGKHLLIKLSGIESPEQAKLFQQCDIAIAHEQLPELVEAEFYWHQLIGLDVINQDQKPVGRVKEIRETGANDVLVVESEQNRQTFIPLVMDVYVKHIDVTNKRILVDWVLED